MTGEPKPGRSARVATWSELQDRQPAYALVENVDLVVIRFDDDVSVLHGRCTHRGALMADALVDGPRLVCVDADEIRRWAADQDATRLFGDIDL